MPSPIPHIAMHQSALRSESRRISFFNTEDPDSQCPPNLSGTDCSIPYQLCPDGKRKCFNNSSCEKLHQSSTSNTGSNGNSNHEYEYKCDCSFASEISHFAGHECEHSATSYCGGKRNPHHFCTNSGLCEDFIYKAQVHTGCNCPRDFAGAHCQYLKALVDMDDIEGEALFPDVGDNFYALTPKMRKSQSVTFGVVVFAMMVLAFVCWTVAKLMKKKRNIRKGRQFVSIATVSPRNDDGLDGNIGLNSLAEKEDGKNVRLQTNENPHAEII